MMSENVTYRAKHMLRFRTWTQEYRTRKHRVFRALLIFFVVVLRISYAQFIFVRHTIIDHVICFWVKSAILCYLSYVMPDFAPKRLTNMRFIRTGSA